MRTRRGDEHTPEEEREAAPPPAPPAWLAAGNARVTAYLQRAWVGWPDGVAINISKPENSAWIVVAREMVPTDQEWEVTAWAICVDAS